MNLATLKTICKAYLQPVAPFDDLMVGGVDLFLAAANNARKSAELLHNFEFARVTALLEIDGVNGTDMGSATVTSWDPQTNVTGIREVTAVLRQRPDGTWIPLDYARVEIPIERDRWEMELSDNMFPYLRYPSDALISSRGSNVSIVQRGRSLFVYPRYANASPSTYFIQLEGFGWLTEYVDLGGADDGPQDFFLAHGYTYLQWAIICELNYVTRQFVTRQEGNLAAPEAARDKAFQQLMNWDSFMVDGNMTRPR